MTPPFEFVIWSAEECAEYLRQSKASFVKRTQYRPGFPNRLPIPGHPRWRAVEVAKWATNYEPVTNGEAVSL